MWWTVKSRSVDFQGQPISAVGGSPGLCQAVPQGAEGGPATLCQNLRYFTEVQVKSQVISLQVQVKSQVIWSDVKSSHKSFGPNTSQVTSLFVQVQVKSHIILSSCNTQSGPGIKSIYSELQSKI